MKGYEAIKIVNEDRLPVRHESFPEGRYVISIGGALCYDTGSLFEITTNMAISEGWEIYERPEFTESDVIAIINLWCDPNPITVDTAIQKYRDQKKREL